MRALLVAVRACIALGEGALAELVELAVGRVGPVGEVGVAVAELLGQVESAAVGDLAGARCGIAPGAAPRVSSGERSTDSWLPRRSRSRAVERGAVPDRDERVLEPASPRMMGVDVAGGDRRKRRATPRDRSARRCGGRRRARRAAAARRRTHRETPRQPCGRVRIDDRQPVSRTAREANEPLRVLGDATRALVAAGSSSRSRPATRVRACASVRIRHRFS